MKDLLEGDRRWAGRAVRTERLLLITLVAVDLLFVAAHLVFDGMWRLERDRGYSELFNYAKLLAIAVTMLLAWRASRQRAFAAWAATFTAMGLDDAFQLHEGVGLQIAAWFDIPRAFSLRGRDYGELAFWAMVAVPLLVVLVATYSPSGDGVRRISRVLAALSGALVFFAVGVDMVHITLGGAAASVAIVVEDGGELLVTSIILALVVAVKRGPDRALWNDEGVVDEDLGAVRSGASGS